MRGEHEIQFNCSFWFCPTGKTRKAANDASVENVPLRSVVARTVFLVTKSMSSDALYVNVKVCACESMFNDVTKCSLKGLASKLSKSLGLVHLFNEY